MTGWNDLLKEEQLKRANRVIAVLVEYATSEPSPEPRTMGETFVSAMEQAGLCLEESD